MCELFKESDAVHIDNGRAVVSGVVFWTLMLILYSDRPWEADLCRCSLEGAPCVETTGKTVGLVAFAHQAQFSRVLCILGPHVLNIDLIEGRHKC